MESGKKHYGLLIPKKTSAVIAPVLKKPSAFNSDSDDEPNSIDWISKTAKKETYGSGKSRQTKADIEKIMKDDPTAYQYDEIYDEMKKKKDETVAALKNDRTPKYMTLLLKQAERRKKEDERRKERQIQKEREAEGDKFADKEVFITSSYKKKLEEIRKMDEEDKRMERLEDIGDVTKQCDLGGFYRHLYASMSTVVEFPGANSETVSTSVAAAASSTKFREFDKRKTRNIRKRVTTSDGENDAESDTDKKTKQSTGDEADTEISKSNGTRVELISPRVPVVESDSKDDPSKKIKTESRSDRDDASEDDDDDDAEDEENDAKPVKIECDKRDVVPKKRIAPERRTDIWVKRTVGCVFEAALLRYRERKSNKIAAC